MVTLSDVAKKAGVSSATVSRVVRGQGKVGDKCRAKVQAVIKEMGYRPNSNARALASNKSSMLGIITPNLSIPFHGAIASGVYEIARDIHYDVLISNSFNDTQTELAAIESFRQQGCDNIIIHSKYTSAETLIEWAEQIPGLVLINRYIAEIAERCVWLDNRKGGELSAEYMLEQGHKKIAVIVSEQKMPDPIERLTGVKQALARAGVVLPEKNIVFIQPSIEQGETAVDMLLKQGQEFSAIIALNDSLAIGAMNRLQDLGKRVPEDIAVIGFDNAAMTKACRPKLTTMNYPVSDMAIFATKLSLDLLENTPQMQHLPRTYLPNVVQRKSA